jgi:hypothetical protein
MHVQCIMPASAAVTCSLHRFCTCDSCQTSYRPRRLGSCVFMSATAAAATSACPHRWVQDHVCFLQLLPPHRCLFAENKRYYYIWFMSASVAVVLPQVVLIDLVHVAHVCFICCSVTKGSPHRFGTCGPCLLQLL